jgi:hypothetical protein
MTASSLAYQKAIAFASWRRERSSSPSGAGAPVSLSRKLARGTPYFAMLEIWVAAIEGI